MYLTFSLSVILSRYIVWQIKDHWHVRFQNLALRFIEPWKRISAPCLNLLTQKWCNLRVIYMSDFMRSKLENAFERQMKVFWDFSAKNALLISTCEVANNAILWNRKPKVANVNYPHLGNCDKFYLPSLLFIKYESK